MWLDNIQISECYNLVLCLNIYKFSVFSFILQIDILNPKIIIRLMFLRHIMLIHISREVSNLGFKICLKTEI